MGQVTQIMKDSEKQSTQFEMKKRSVWNEKEKSNVESNDENHLRVWKRVLAAAEKGIKPKNDWRILFVEPRSSNNLCWKSLRQG